MNSLRCFLGWHHWRYVGEQRRAERFGWTGWNHECERCGQTIHLSIGPGAGE